MKKYFSLLFASLLALSVTSCKDDDSETPTYELSVQLAYPENTAAAEGVNVTLTSTQGTTITNPTDAQGVALFKVPSGIYSVAATDKQSRDGVRYILNGNLGEVSVTKEAVNVTLEMLASTSNQIIIKELYIGGCPTNDGANSYQRDPYVILYNNSDAEASVDNLCLGMCLPFNAHANNKNYVDGKLSYENDGFIPAGYGIWYFPGIVTLAPYSEIVVAINGAIDHTVTYSNSVNLANSAYYACYDTDDWFNANYYPAPSEVIPTAHYLQAEKWGLGNAWPLSVLDPAFFIFRTEGVTPTDFAAAKDYWYNGGQESDINACLKVKTEWVLDAVDVFTTTAVNNQKRLTAVTDAGSVYFTNKKGYSMFRHVDLEATKAIEGNESLLIYGMTANTDEATGVVLNDANQVDAVASAKNGAKIIYKDTNNSTNDFFERYQASLKD